MKHIINHYKNRDDQPWKHTNFQKRKARETPIESKACQNSKTHKYYTLVAMRTLPYKEEGPHCYQASQKMNFEKKRLWNHRHFQITFIQIDRNEKKIIVFKQTLQPTTKTPHQTSTCQAQPSESIQKLNFTRRRKWNDQIQTKKDADGHRGRNSTILDKKTDKKK